MPLCRTLQVTICALSFIVKILWPTDENSAIDRSFLLRLGGRLFCEKIKKFHICYVLARTILEQGSFSKRVCMYARTP
jgi:hypothetical protein